MVENPFHPEWLSRMGECKAACPDTLFIWLHPFTEDLVVEPLGLFNYVLPVFTEFLSMGTKSLRKCSAAFKAMPSRRIRKRNRWRFPVTYEVLQGQHADTDTSETAHCHSGRYNGRTDGSGKAGVFDGKTSLCPVDERTAVR